MSVALESPAMNRSMTKQKRKRRPTRTPKPTTPQSAAKRLCSPSPFLDRSFQRKKLYFGGSINNNDKQQRDSDDSEYNPDDSLVFDEEDEYEESTEYHDYDHCYDDNNEQKQELNMKKPPKFDLSQPRSTTADLLSDIQNLSINNAKNHELLRNARASIKRSKSPSVSTPTLFDENATKITSKIKKKPSVKKQQNENENNAKNEKQDKKVTMVRITKSHRVFKKCHKFDRLLVKPLECGSGCPLYCSYWKDKQSVTKLMPLFENEEFTKEENVDNALREFEFHADIYRKGVKLYGMDETPTCPIYACVNLKHDGECDKNDPNDKPKPYLAFVMPQYHCNLAQFVGKYRKLNDIEANKLLVTGLRFLKLLQENQMVHCDIKPENIFLDVRMAKYGDGVRIHHFVFADFGCAALKTEEFPYGNLTGTITMWDLAALGRKYGDENGFDARNDLYGFIGSLLDGVYGGSIMEELLEEADEHWEETEWNEYGQLIRKCRREMMSDKFMERELNELKLKDGKLRTVLLQVGKRRKDRMTLKQILSLIDIEC